MSVKQIEKHKDTKIYVVEVGVVLDEENEEFEFYKIKDFYDNYYSFYDENRVLFLSYKEAKEFVDDYVLKGVENTYGIIRVDRLSLTAKEIEYIKEHGYFDDYCTEPTKKDLIELKIKQNKKIKLLKGKYYEKN